MERPACPEVNEVDRIDLTVRMLCSGESASGKEWLP
jgi:hypothetical protein